MSTKEQLDRIERMVEAILICHMGTKDKKWFKFMKRLGWKFPDITDIFKNRGK